MRISSCRHCERSEAIPRTPVIPASALSGVEGKAGIQSQPRRHREPRRGVAIQFLLLVLHLVYPMSSHAQTIPIGQNKIINHTVTLAPGFATMIQFPDIILSMDLADTRIIHCERSTVDNDTALCKPKTYDAHSTNMIVSTENNKFNLTMQIDPEQKTRPDVIIFMGNGNNKTVNPKVEYNECRSTTGRDYLLDDMVTTFRVENFRRSVGNDYGRLKTDKIMFVGNQIYLTFSIENENFMTYEILRVDIYVENLGGMTGMAIRSEKPLPADYRLTSHSLSSGEVSIGIIKFKNSILAENQAFSLRVVEKTDKRKDLYFKFDTGV